MSTFAIRRGLIALCPLALAQGAGADPVAAPGWMMTTYAQVKDPVVLAFAADGSLYAGRDNWGSGGGFGDAVKIHKIGPGGGPVTEFGKTAVNDPDTVGVDDVGAFTGTPGAVIIGGITGNTGIIWRVLPNGDVTKVYNLESPFHNPGQFQFNGAGRLFMADVGNANDDSPVGATDGNGQMKLLFEVEHGSYGICLLPGGKILSSNDVGRVDMYSTQGQLLEPDFADVEGFALLAAAKDDEFLAYAGTRLGKVLAITDTGEVVEAATGFVQGQIGGVAGIEVGDDKAIYGSDFTGDRIVRITRCSANCDGSNALDLFDFLCFVNLFTDTDPYADFDGSGVHDLFDFLAFVNAFNEGCG
jgi:hypothetical protein